MIFHDAQLIFNLAIKYGHLSENEASQNWAGYYMYMHTDGNKHYFKHIHTRKYLILEFGV